MADSAPIVESPVGKPLPRIDGPLKVSGAAMYTADFHFPGLLYAVPVPAAIASGTVAAIDSTAAMKMAGVRAVYTHENIGRFYRIAPNSDFSAVVDEHRPPLEDNVVRYYGQYVAVVVAETLEQATAAGGALRISYHATAANTDSNLEPEGKPAIDSVRGDVEKAFAAGPVAVDQLYVTPDEVHNPIEAHASLAVWDGPSVTLYETTQAVDNHRQVLSEMLGIPRENMRVVMQFLGSGFGGKLWPWTHSLLAAASARHLQRPVKLVVSRKMMFAACGHRPRTAQRVRLSATPDGKLTSLQHDFVNQTSILDSYKENCGEATPFLYSTPNLRVTSALAHRNVGTPTSMRGPGAVPGLFALESAMDELAIALKMDPVALRLRNEPSMDESLNIPFSSRHLKECLEEGAKKFGWRDRDPGIGAMRRDGLTIGWGVAAGAWIAARFDCRAGVELLADGGLRVSCGTQDIGTGTYTVFAQVASDATGVAIDRIEVALGDTRFPPGPISGGSMATASVIPAIQAAAYQAGEKLVGVAIATSGSPFAGQAPDALAFVKGYVQAKDGSGPKMSFQEILKAADVRRVAGEGSSPGTFRQAFGLEKAKLSSHSFIAQFVEVTWQPELARLRVSRMLSVVDAGRMINARTARNQIEGSQVMGIGMALFEHMSYDRKTGAPINSNLADYVVSTHADTPALEVAFLDYPDYSLNALGARGVGEIGLAGTAAAIANAVHHATGRRIRELPIKIEDLI
jgi:xanthine dehydrogenase YagR molybdenum-binding subunit